MEAIETINHPSGLIGTVEYDELPSSPREWDNLGTIIHWHRRLDLGEEDALKLGIEPDDFRARAKAEKLIVLSLFVYEHSGYTVRTSSFGDPWDSGQVGYVYVSPERVRENFMVKRITKAIRQRAIDGLVAEVREYADFLEGRVYGYVVKDPEGNVLDSCWGFIGDSDDALEELKAGLEAAAPDYEADQALAARKELGA